LADECTHVFARGVADGFRIDGGPRLRRQDADEKASDYCEETESERHLGGGSRTARGWYHRAEKWGRKVIYPFFRPLLFALDPETAHAMAFASLDAATRLGIARA